MPLEGGQSSHEARQVKFFNCLWSVPEKSHLGFWPGARYVIADDFDAGNFGPHFEHMAEILEQIS